MASDPPVEAAIRLRYEEIADELQLQIASGLLKPSDRLPTLRELRRDYGVTQATVDRALAVLERKALITRSHRNGVFVAPPESKPLTGRIGFCGVDFAKTDFSAYWTRLLEGVESQLRARGMQLMLVDHYATAGWDQIDGLLVNCGEAAIPVRQLSPRLPLVAFFPPVVFVDDAGKGVKSDHAVTGISVDDYAGMRLATEHLLALGHRRIAFLNNSLSDTVIYARRLAGYQDALRAAGITPNKKWLRTLPSPPAVRLYFMNAGREAMKQWLAKDWRQLGCTALLVHNDDAAWGAIEAFREAGIDVPGQVSVVGFDGTEVAECCTPHLTTVEVPLQEMGRCGVELLWRQINGEQPPASVVFPAQLRVRASTAPPA